MADENLVIDIDTDDTTQPVPVTKAEPVVQKSKEPAVEELKTQFEALQRTQEQTGQALQQEAQRRQRAEQDAAHAREDATKARTAATESDINSVENAIAAAQAESEQASSEWQTAQESGDYSKARELARKIARAEAKIVRLEEGRADLEARKAEPVVTRAEQTRQVPAAEPDPFERALAGVTPRTAAWLREHPEFVTDKKLNQKANAAHASAVAEDYIPDTPAYFDFCERYLGLKDEPAARAEQKPATTRTRPAMPAAPVSRDAGSNGSLGNNQVVLTPGEQRAATDGTHVFNWDDPNGKFKKGEPIGLKEMARRKAAMTAEGRYANTFTDQ